MTELDNKLADFTDSLLEADDTQQPKISADHLSDEEAMVVRLQQMMRPKEPIDPAFQQRLTQAINVEWEKSPPKQSRTRRKIIPLHLTSIQLAAAGVLIALVAVAVLLSGETSSDEQTGTATGGGEEALVILGGIGIMLAIGWLFWNRRR